MSKLTRETTPEEATVLQSMAESFAPELAKLDNAILSTLAFVALIEMAHRDGPAAAAEWMAKGSEDAAQDPGCY